MVFCDAEICYKILIYFRVLSFKVKLTVTQLGETLMTKKIFKSALLRLFSSYSSYYLILHSTLLSNKKTLFFCYSKIALHVILLSKIFSFFLEIGRLPDYKAHIYLNYTDTTYKKGKKKNFKLFFCDTF